MNNLVAQLLALDLDCDWSTRREAADTLLALQTQLAAAEVKAKEWIDVAYEAASQKEELKRELERVEREAERYRKIREMPIHFLDDNDEHGATIYRMGTEVDAVVDRREAEFFATAPSPPDAPPRSLE